MATAKIAFELVAGRDGAVEFWLEGNDGTFNNLDVLPAGNSGYRLSVSHPIRMSDPQGHDGAPGRQNRASLHPG